MITHSLNILYRSLLDSLNARNSCIQGIMPAFLILLLVLKRVNQECTVSVSQVVASWLVVHSVTLSTALNQRDGRGQTRVLTHACFE